MFVTFGKIETSINNLPKILIILKTKGKATNYFNKLQTNYDWSNLSSYAF